MLLDAAPQSNFTCETWLYRETERCIKRCNNTNHHECCTSAILFCVAGIRLAIFYDLLMHIQASWMDDRIIWNVLKTLYWNRSRANDTIFDFALPQLILLHFDVNSFDARLNMYIILVSLKILITVSVHSKSKWHPTDYHFYSLISRCIFT